MDSMNERANEKQPLLPPKLQTEQPRCRLPSFKTFSIIFTGLMFLVATIFFIMKSNSNVGTVQKSHQYYRNLEPNIPAQQVLLRSTWAEGKERVDQMKDLELRLVEKGIVPQKESAWSTMQYLFRSRDPVENLAECAFIVEHMKRNLKKCLSDAYLPDYCKSSIPNSCEIGDYNYRTFNGSCNNLRYPEWGMAQTGFLRLLDADYADGVSEPRRSVTGKPLPNARLISSTFYSHQTLPDANFTLMAMTFGLILDHDMIQIAIQTNYDGTPITCCDKRVSSNPKFRHPECLEIKIPPNDPFYGPRKVDCIDFVRSKPISGKCIGIREQINSASTYIDGSAVYGSSEKQNRELRSFKNGLLANQRFNGHYLLPIDAKQSCGSIKKPVNCMAAGDFRVNENPDLVSMHSIWFREHNRIALKLGSFHPDWNDEKLFQESRRIVAAEMQYIAYNEFLPLLLGPEAMKKYGLTLNKDLKYDGYDSNEEGGIYNVFAAAAFRFGHSLVKGLLKLYDKHNHVNIVALHKTFNNPELLYRGAYDALLKGMLLQKTHSVSNYVTTEVRNRLFQPPSSDSGLDLSAFSIQRGREHGVPAYTAWRKVCGLPLVNEWDDLYDIMKKENVDKLKDIYASVHDIDLIPASLAENHADGSMLGPTYVCLIAKQFRKIRFADRFWFEVRNEKWSFTEDQLKEIYKTSMSRIICDNSDSIKHLQAMAFQIPSTINPVVECNTIPGIDISKW